MRRSHREHFAALQARNAAPATPCSAHSLTYGGRCLNCGWDPNRPEEDAVDEHSRKHLLQHAAALREQAEGLRRDPLVVQSEHLVALLSHLEGLAAWCVLEAGEEE